MDDSVLGFLGFVLIFVVLDIAALRYGVDSRTGTRELPNAGDITPTFARPSGHRLHAMREALRQRWLSATFLEPRMVDRAHQKPVRPMVPHPICFHRVDLAAAGK